MKKIRIGAGQGFYGDSNLPAIETAKRGNVQYLCFDSLAELTLTILQKDRLEALEAFREKRSPRFTGE